MVDFGLLSVAIDQQLRPYVLAREPDDDHVHVRLVGRIGVPHERLVREVDADAIFEERPPERLDLLALAYGVGGDEGAAGMGSAHVVGGLPMPACDVVEDAARLPEQVRPILPLLGIEVRVPDEGRVADDVRDLTRRGYVVPVDAQGVGVRDVAVVAQRQLLVDAPRHFRRVGVRLLLRDPQRRARYAAGEVLQLYAAEAREADQDHVVFAFQPLEASRDLGILVQLQQDLVFEAPQA